MDAGIQDFCLSLRGSVGWVRVFTAAVRSLVAPLSFSKPNALARSEKSRFSSE